MILWCHFINVWYYRTFNIICSNFSYELYKPCNVLRSCCFFVVFFLGVYINSRYLLRDGSAAILRLIKRCFRMFFLFFPLPTCFFFRLFFLFVVLGICGVCSFASFFLFPSSCSFACVFSFLFFSFFFFFFFLCFFLFLLAGSVVFLIRKYVRSFFVFLSRFYVMSLISTQVFWLFKFLRDN